MGSTDNLKKGLGLLTKKKKKLPDELQNILMSVGIKIKNNWNWKPKLRKPHHQNTLYLLLEHLQAQSPKSA